ncbi:MAG: hypothetical protein ABSA18_17720 [Dehalococcoidia bacterium]
MDEHLKQNYIQAKSLIEGFRLNISRLDSATREKSWKALESQVKALGFDSVQSVFDFEKEYALDLIMYADAGFKEVVRFVKTQKFLFALGARQLTIDGKIPNTLYISNLDRYYVLVSPDYDLAKEIDLDYCKGNGIIVRPSFIKRGDRPFGVICHGTGVIHVGGHLKDQGMFNYNALQLLVGEVLKRNNVPFVYSNNDGLINGSKIAGGLMWREDEILTVAFYISHHLDKTIYKCLVYIDPTETEGKPEEEYKNRIKSGVADAELIPEYVERYIREFIPYQ